MHLGMIEDDREHDAVMREAGMIQFGTQLVECFTTLLLLASPSSPLEFYNRHRTSLLCDFLRETNNDEVDVENKVLQLIDDRLGYENKELKDFGLPWIEVTRVLPLLIQAEINFDIGELRTDVLSVLNTMTQEQKSFFVAYLIKWPNAPYPLI